MGKRMLGQILLSYKSKVKLNRVEFFVGQVLFSAVSIAVLWLHYNLYGLGQVDASYLIGKSFLGFVLSLLILPLFLARLRDMGWNLYLALLIFPSQIVNTRNLIIYMEVKGVESLNSLTFFMVELAVSLMFLILFACMLFVKSFLVTILVHRYLRIEVSWQIYVRKISVDTCLIAIVQTMGRRVLVLTKFYGYQG